MRLGLSLSVFAITLFAVTHINAHTRWSDGTITPRSPNDGIKVGPCGPDPVGPLPARKDFLPGETINVEWEETIDHQGMFYIYFSENDEDGLPADPADLADPTGKLFEMIDPDNAVPAIYNADITLPMDTCDNCTLQLIQEMVNGGISTNYYSCADIRITANPVTPLDVSVIQGVYDDFTQLDTDGSDSLSFLEIAGGITISQDQFDLMDTDDDSQIDKDELVAAGASVSDDGETNASSNGDAAAMAAFESWALVFLVVLGVFRRISRLMVANSLWVEFHETGWP